MKALASGALLALTVIIPHGQRLANVPTQLAPGKGWFGQPPIRLCLSGPGAATIGARREAEDD